jgi:hypothetical protein
MFLFSVHNPGHCLNTSKFAGIVQNSYETDSLASARLMHVRGLGSLFAERGVIAGKPTQLNYKITGNPYVFNNVTINSCK